MGLAVVLAVVTLNAATDFFSGLERRFYDLASTQTSRLPSDRIAVIAIDDQSVANIGRWPWPREVHAQLIDQLGAAGAKTVAHTAFFFEPQTDRGLVQLRELRGLLDGSQTGSAPLTDLGDQGRQRLLGFIGQAERQLDSDARLVASMARAGNVIVPSVFELGEPQGRVDQPLPVFAQRSAVADNSAFGVPALRSQQPLPAIGEAARAVGHLNQLPDVDGAVRQEGLLVQFDGFAVPSMALAISANSLNLTAKDMQLLPGEGVQLGRSVIPTDSSARLLPQFYPDRDGKPAFAVDSFYDVLSGRIPASKYADKIVIIGATAAGVGTLFTTPVSAAMSPAAILAHITSSILSNHHIVQPLWGGYAVLAALLLIAGYIVWLLPRLSAAAGAACTAALFVALLGAEFGLLSVAATWLPLVFPASLLLIGHLALTTRRFLVTEAGKAKSDEESAETNRMMGLALQGQGQLDMAFDRMRRVPFSDALMDNLKHLALDFERKRQFNKAEAVFRYMFDFDPKFRDLESRLTRARQSIQEQKIPFEIPSGEELSPRLDGVLQIIYLLFNEGYKASSGESLVRAELCHEAIRLAHLLIEHPAANLPRTHALLALMLLDAARLPGRTDAEGKILRLKEQDRSTWDRNLIRLGIQHLAQAAVGDDLSEYHLQAGIAAFHCTAKDYPSTNWRAILAQYDRWLEMTDSPVVALNRAVALAKVEGPQAGLEAVEAIASRRQLESYYLTYAVLGEFETQLGRF
ncbi:MAG: CHASE2 domain-containing protein, partial [Variovorax sp.]|nr:CHASE2 domain-containing protein [Variovorax sp.]